MLYAAITSLALATQASAQERVCIIPELPSGRVAAYHNSALRGHEQFVDRLKARYDSMQSLVGVTKSFADYAALLLQFDHAQTTVTDTIFIHSPQGPENTLMLRKDDHFYELTGFTRLCDAENRCVDLEAVLDSIRQ